MYMCMYMYITVCTCTCTYSSLVPVQVQFVSGHDIEQNRASETESLVEDGGYMYILYIR